MQMTITQLETFLKIAETKNFTSAAGGLGYAQSTVTTQIKQLEDELGCLLFERLGKTIVLTPEGEKLLAYAERILQLEREIRLEVPDAKEPSGILKIGVSESLCYNRLPKFLMEYKKAYPKVDIKMQFVTHDEIPALLKKGEIDLVYTLNPLLDDENLLIIDKKPESLGFYVSPTHPLARKAISEKDLKDIPLLVTSQSCSFRQLLVKDLAASGISPVIAVETSSKEILKQFASNGLGVAFIPDMTAENEIDKNILTKLRWKGEDFRIYSQLIVHKDKKLSKAIKGFADIVTGNWVD